MATNGADPSAQHDTSDSALTSITTSSPTSQTTSTALAFFGGSGQLQNMTVDQQNDYIKYFRQQVVPGLSERGIGSTNIWSEMLEELTFQIVQPKDVTDVLGLIDGLRSRMPQDVVETLHQLISKLLRTLDVATPRLLESLEQKIHLQLEVHTMQQTAVLDKQRELDVKLTQYAQQCERVNQLIDNFDKESEGLRNEHLDLMRGGITEVAEAVIDTTISKKISGLFVPFKTDMNANWTSHKAAVQKDNEDFRANINGRITNQVKTECATALKPHLDRVDELKPHCETIAKTAEGKNDALDQLLEKVKNQQSTLSSEIDKVRKDHSNFVIQNSTEFKDLRATVQEHSETLTTFDDKINTINKKIWSQTKGFATLSTEILDHIGPGLERVSDRSKENRQALERVLHSIVHQTFVLIKLDKAATKGGLLRPDGTFALGPREHCAFEDGLDKTADQVFTDPKFLRDSQICIDILDPEEAEKAKKAEKAGKAKRSKDAS